MSFTNLMYDGSNTKNALRVSQGPGVYQVGTPKTCIPCYQPNPEIRLQKNGVSIQDPSEQRFYAGPIDVESKLIGIERAPINYTLQSQCDCDNKKYACTCGVGGNFGRTKNMPTCYLPTENTRLSNPPTNLRGTGINRFNPLCLNPQKKLFLNATYNIPTQMLLKKAFRPCVATPAVNGMIPKQKPLPKFKTVAGAPASYIGPMYQYDVCG